MKKYVSEGGRGSRCSTSSIVIICLPTTYSILLLKSWCSNALSSDDDALEKIVPTEYKNELLYKLAALLKMIVNNIHICFIFRKTSFGKYFRPPKRGRIIPSSASLLIG